MNLKFSPQIDFFFKWTFSLNLLETTETTKLRNNGFGLDARLLERNLVNCSMVYLWNIIEFSFSINPSSVAESIVTKLIISLCENLVERHSFHIVLSKLSEAMQELCLPTRFPHKELGEITVFFAVLDKILKRKKNMFIFTQSRNL